MSETTTELPSQTPWHIQAMLKVGMTFGVPFLIVAFYLSQEAGWVPNPTAIEMAKMEGQVEELKGLSLLHEFSMKELARVVGEQTSELKSMREERRMKCVLRATTPDQKRACFPQP
jgi:hypothetical protein